MHDLKVTVHVFTFFLQRLSYTAEIISLSLRSFVLEKHYQKCTKGVTILRS